MGLTMDDFHQRNQGYPADSNNGYAQPNGSQGQQKTGGSPVSAKNQMTLFLYACRSYGKWPLIFVNTFVVVVELLMG